MSCNRTSYERYIAGPEWRALRLKALQRDGHRCRICNSADDLEVHHRFYPSDGRWERDGADALTSLCVPCHDMSTTELRRRRYAARAIPAPRDVVRITPIIERSGSSGRV